ncbi:MAG: hypothetical protein ACI35O_02480 [Bacillaceae bacterium]
MTSIDDYPNVLVVPENQETPEDIIEDYLDLIQDVKKDPDFLRELLQMFFDDVNFWSVRQLLIDQAKVNLQQLQELQDTVYVEEDDE